MPSDNQLDLQFRPRAVSALTVTQLVRMVSATLEQNLDGFWVTGEVSNARIPASGHFYFTLKDDRSSISVVMFRGTFARVRFKIADGMAVVVHGHANLFEARGQLQIIAEELEPRGVGALQLAFEQLKRRLEAEGLFSAARKRPMPFLPRVIGIVTARSGAGLKDILRVIGDRFPGRHLIFRAAQVQGDGAAEDIVAAIEELNRDGRAEVLIVGRGGGSLEDLWAFNEEMVARAIFNSAIPIISAVGHEIDYTIADFVADLRAPTPTAAAQMVVPSRAELAERIAAAELTLIDALERRIGEARERVDDLASRLRHPGTLLREARAELARLVLSAARAMRSQVRERAYRVENGAARLSSANIAMLAVRRNRLSELAAQLGSLSPLKVLERGYAVVSRASDRKVVTDAASVSPGEDLSVRLMRGGLRVRTVAREN